MDKSCPIAEPFRNVAGSVFFLTLLFFLPFLGRFIFSPLMPTIGSDIGITPSQAGSVFFFGSFGVLAGSLAAGFVSERIDHRGTLFAAAFGVACALFASSLVESVWGLRLVMVALGLFSGLNQPSIVSTITAMVQRQDWGKALSVQQAAPPLSLVVGPLLAVALLSVFSWKVALVWVGVFTALSALTLLAFRGLASFPGEAPRPALVGPIMRGRSFWLLILLFAVGMGAQVGVYSMLPLYLTEERGMTVNSANTLLGLSNLSPLVVVFAAGWITDRMGEKRTMFGVVALTGVVTMLLGLLDGVGLSVSVFLLPAFAVCLFPPAFSALSRIVQPNLRSVAAALAPPLAFLLGGGVLPQWLGFMGERYTFSLGIVLTGIVFLLCSFAALWLRLLRDDEMEDGC